MIAKADSYLSTATSLLDSRVHANEAAPAQKQVFMVTYQPATPHSDSIKRPNCAKCGGKMNLFGIEAINPKHELLTFVCPECQSVETRIADV